MNFLEYSYSDIALPSTVYHLWLEEFWQVWEMQMNFWFRAKTRIKLGVNVLEFFFFLWLCFWFLGGFCKGHFLMKVSAAFTAWTKNQGFPDEPHAYNVFVPVLKNRFICLAGSGLSRVVQELHCLAAWACVGPVAAVLGFSCPAVHGISALLLEIDPRYPTLEAKS